MTPERLQQIKERYADEMIRREHVAELIDAVDHLTAENARLREGIEALALEAEHAVDAKNPLSPLGRALLMWQPEALRALLTPPTEGETEVRES